MSDPMKLTDPPRLDELAAVTREYARYSRRAFGFASVALGAWIAAALAVGAVSIPWSSILFACGSLAWVLLVPRARAYYQRHGRVIEPEPDMSGLAGEFFALFLWVFALYLPLRFWIHYRTWASASGVVGWAGLAVAAAAVLATAALARTRLTGAGDLLFPVLLMILAMDVDRSVIDSVATVAVTALFAALNIVKGVYDHVAFRRLERRLAALKGRA